MRRLLLCLSFALSLAGSLSASAQTLVNGAGSTFIFPLASKWFSEYAAIDPGVRFNYQSIGSGAGIRQVIDRTVDFGASDAPLTDAQLATAPDLLHVPATLGAVAVAYRLPGNPALRLSAETLAGLYLGEISSWDDPRVANDNPGVALPKLAVTVVHRSDGSGTSAIFTDYLAKVSPTWAAKVRHGTAVHWPVGLGGKGNEGVSGQLSQIPGSVGYVELAYAAQNRLPVAKLRNRAGAWVSPTVESTSAAARASSIPKDLRVSLTDSPGADAYPIVGFSYLLVHRDQTDPVKGPALARFLEWALHAGQKDAPALLYAPLPANVVALDEEVLRQLTLNGRPLPIR